jgi:NarL family two-component system response regulator LiaR
LIVSLRRLSFLYSGWQNNDMIAFKILLADDNEEFRASLAEYLDQQSGVAVVGQVGDGRAAIYATHSLRPDLVLMDISMPGMSGLEAARQIKGFAPSTKIVFVTIHEDKTYQALAEVLGVDGFVCKSSVKQDLPKVLARVLGDGPNSLNSMKEHAG